MNRIENIFGADALKSKPAIYLDRSDAEVVAACPHQGQLRKKYAAEIAAEGQLLHEQLEEKNKK